VHTGFLVGKPEGKRTPGIPRHKKEDNGNQDIRWGPWTGFIWLRIGTGGGLL
jgi:hypothetical protein